MKYAEFKEVVRQAHGHVKYALLLWHNLLDRSIIVKPSQIPCIAWCILTFDLPVVIAKRLRLQGAI